MSVETVGLEAEGGLSPVLSALRRLGNAGSGVGVFSSSPVESSSEMAKAAIQRGARGGKLTPAQIEARAQQRVEDDELIREAQRGERAAFDSLVRRYDQSVLRLALHMLGN